MLSTAQEVVGTQVECLLVPENPHLTSSHNGPGTFLFKRKERKAERYLQSWAEKEKKDDKIRAKLNYWEDIPTVLQFNKYIRSGYRTGLSYSKCVASILGIHNETGNIWTHLVPAVFLLLLVFSGLEQPWTHAPVGYYTNVLSMIGCFLLSVCYHTFMGCHHHYGRWLTLDVCGVYMALLGSEWVAILWSFPCHPNVRLFATGLYYTIGFAGLPFSCLADSAVVRGVPMLALTTTRIGLLVLRGVLTGWSGPAVGLYWGMEALVLFGGVVNVARWPERWFQPKGPRQAAVLDYWGNSHQIMHVAVAAGLLLVHRAMAFDLRESLNPKALCPAS